jgi:hypothetical protein
MVKEVDEVQGLTNQKATRAAIDDAVHDFVNPHARSQNALLTSRAPMPAGDTNPVDHDSCSPAATRYGRPIASGTRACGDRNQ